MREWTAMSLVAALMEVPEGYRVVLCGDDAIEVSSFHVLTDDVEQVVRLTAWEETFKEVRYA